MGSDRYVAVASDPIQFTAATGLSDMAPTIDIDLDDDEAAEEVDLDDLEDEEETA